MCPETRRLFDFSSHNYGSVTLESSFAYICMSLKLLISGEKGPSFGSDSCDEIRIHSESCQLDVLPLFASRDGLVGNIDGSRKEVLTWWTLVC